MIERLAWDSEFFGYEVGRAQVFSGSFDHTEFMRASKDYALVYVISDARIPSLPLFDVKVVLERESAADEVLEAPEGVRRTGPPVSDALYRLALESGVHSRYRLDPGFTGNEFERLYRRWIERSVASAEEEVLTTADETGLTGFVSIAHGPSHSTIGLIAVEERARGKGLGGKLLQASAHAARHAGNLKVRVATQDGNAPAMALYDRLGFRVIERTWIHHIRPVTSLRA